MQKGCSFPSPRPGRMELLAFVSLVAAGEAFWYPALPQIAAAVATDGQLGLYFALSNAPLFLGKLSAGVLSGFLLEKLCPTPPCEHGGSIWLAVAAVGLTTPCCLAAMPVAAFRGKAAKEHLSDL